MSGPLSGRSCVCFAVLRWLSFFVCCPWLSVATERWPSSLAEPSTESFNARQLRAQRRLARMPRRVRSTARAQRSHLKPRRTALGKARQAPLQRRKVPAMPARAAKAAAGDGDGGRKRRLSIPASTRAPQAIGSSPPPGKHGHCEPPDGTAEAISTGCQHGMVGTSPNCHCPTNSELLGGNCVHYTAMCHSGLAADANPQACPGAEEKLARCARTD